MNKAVVEFYKSGQTTTGTLKQNLVAIKHQVTTEICLIFQFTMYVFLVLAKALETVICVYLSGSHNSRGC